MNRPEADLRRVLAARIRGARQRRGLSVLGLAKSSGVSAPFISQLEHGRSGITVEQLARLGMALGTTLSEILGGLDRLLRSRAPGPRRRLSVREARREAPFFGPQL